MPCAASPPSAFCQEKVVTSSLGQSRSCAKAAEVASQIVRPLRSAAIQFGVGNAHARGGAVPGEDDVVVEIDLGEIGQLAVGRLQRARVLELELLDDVGDPAFAEALPRQHVDAARAEQRPQRHLDRAGVGAGRDADAIVGGNAEHFARQVDRVLELGLAELGAMRAAERRVLEGFGGPAGPLGAGAGRKTRVMRPRGGRRSS